MSQSKSHEELRNFLVLMADEAFSQKTWHGPNLLGSIRRVPAEQVTWRPKMGRHNIVEITAHCAYWKYAVRRKIRGDKRGSFPLKGSNWFKLPAKLTTRQWREYVAMLEAEHEALRDALAAAPFSMLTEKRDGKSQLGMHVYGVVLHDTYHAGQIRLLKTLYKQAMGSKK